MNNIMWLEIKIENGNGGGRITFCILRKKNRIKQNPDNIR